MTDAVSPRMVDSGDHACLTFTDGEERVDLVAAFVRDGLLAGQKVICWTDGSDRRGLVDQLTVRGVGPRPALRRGQLRIAPVAQSSSLSDGAADGTAMLQALSDEVDAASRDGYPGLRVTADMTWATGPHTAAEELVAFESKVAALFDDERLCLICQYDRDRFDAVTLAFAAHTHPKTVAAQVYHDHPLLRICRQYRPPGIRVAGQLDFRHRDVLEHALAESRRLDRHMHLNLAGLDYLDGACAGVIVATAARLPASRRMTITCRRAVATVLELSGADAAARLRVVPVT